MKLHHAFPSLFMIAASQLPAFADHGPGTSGSGFSTHTAETLKPHRFSCSVQTDWTEFDVPAGMPEGVDLLDRSYLTTFNMSYGVIENFQLGLTYGYYAADGNREFESGDKLTFDPDGFTDLWLTGKLRIHQGPLGQFALLAGLKAPTGDSTLTNNDGEPVEPSATAGTGAWDAQTGAAYSIALNPTLAFDASAIYTFRGERHHYGLGDRLDIGASLAWHLRRNQDTHRQISLIAETVFRHIQKSKVNGIDDDATGGTALFLSPGVKYSFTEQSAFNLAVQLPVAQNLNGGALKTDSRLLVGFSHSF